METKEKFRSNMAYYWLGYGLIVMMTFMINMFVIREFKNFSFELFFLFIIPVWFATLIINNLETERIKTFLEKYLIKNYSEMYLRYTEKPVDYLLSDTEHILDLLKSEELQGDPVITALRKESKNITSFLVTVFLSMPAVFFLSVFGILKW